MIIRFSHRTGCYPRSWRLNTFRISKPGAMALSTEPVLQQFRALQLEPSKPASCYPESNPLDVYKLHISKTIAELFHIDAATVFPALQRPQSIDHGDLAIAVPALRVKGVQPKDLATKLVEQFPSSPFVQKLIATGIHVSFFLEPTLLTQTLLPSILENRSTWGTNPTLGLRNPKDEKEGRKKVVIEFSSPNIAKPFHAGHLRSTIIGGFLVNIFRASGYDVVALNYLGDYGKQYGLLAVGFEEFGNEEELEQDPINHLFKVYVKINQLVAEEKEAIKKAEDAGQDVTDMKKNSFDEKARAYFKSICDKDPKAIALWLRFRQLSITRYKEVYARLNIHFDEYSGESQVPEETMQTVETRLSDIKASSISDGATVVDFTKQIPGKLGKQLGVALIRKQDGTSLYLTRDLGAILERQARFKFDKMIYVVADSQNLHFQQLFQLTGMLDKVSGTDISSKLSHVNFGLVRGMSTRKGTVVFLDEILKEVGEKMHEVMRKNEDKYSQVTNPEKTADTLGISSVMIQDMAGKRVNGYEFRMDVATSFEGDTGPYLQYSHTRLCSIVKKANLTPTEIATANLSHLTEPHAINVVRTLVQYPDIVQMTMTTLEPATIVTYLFRLTHTLNSSYDVLRVVGSPEEIMKARLALYDATRAVLNHGMRLLGLSPVERM